MQFDKIKQEWEQTQSQIADMRARLVDERRKHEDAIKAIEGLMAQLPGGSKAATTKKKTALPEALAEGLHGAMALDEARKATIGEAIIVIAKESPGITTAQLVAAMPERPRKSVENTASMLVSKGKLVRDGKGYAVAS